MTRATLEMREIESAVWVLRKITRQDALHLVGMFGRHQTTHDRGNRR